MQNLSLFLVIIEQHGTAIISWSHYCFVHVEVIIKNSPLVLTQTLKGLNIWLFSLVYAAETGAQFSVMCTQLEKRLFLKI